MGIEGVDVPVFVERSLTVLDCINDEVNDISFWVAEKDIVTQRVLRIKVYKNLMNSIRNEEYK